MVNIIFLGAPGSGKGTQSALLSRNLNIPNISTGEILRNEVNDQTETGKLAKSYMDSGILVPDELVVNIIKGRIVKNDCINGFILDGFPRNISQALILEDMLNNLNKNIDIVINIEVENEVIIKRISGRFSCKNCGEVYNKFFNNLKKDGICDKCGEKEFVYRNDDNENTVRNRLEIYNNNTKDLISFYEKKGLIYSVNGLKNIALVSFEINNIVKTSINQIKELSWQE